MAGKAKIPFVQRLDALVRKRLPAQVGDRVSRALIRCAWVVDLYRLNLAIARPATWRGRVLRLLHATRQATDRKWVLFRPDLPEYRHILYKICVLLGYRITADPTKSFNAAIKWKDATFSDPETVLSGLADRNPVFNLECHDISKTRADVVFEQVFGYRLTLDPRTHVGPCVRKSDLNARHDGAIIECPVRPEPGFVYQKVVDNEVDGGSVQDVRVPVFKDMIPLVYLKYRPLARRFSNANTRVELANPDDVFSANEQERILGFCRRMGVDYGELDVLRHRQDGRLYIVDVNTTPWGPPVQLSGEGKRVAVRKLAAAFESTFLQSV